MTTTTEIKTGYFPFYDTIDLAWSEMSECEYEEDDEETPLCSYINLQDLLAVYDEDEEEIEVQYSGCYTVSYGKRYYCLPLAMYEQDSDCSYPIWTVKGDILIYRPEKKIENS
jgi:hypothetical protein